MNIVTIPLRNIRRKPSKVILLLLVFSLGIMSIVSLYLVSQVVGHNLEKKLISFGANIVVAPAAETLSVSYGGFHMGDMLYNIQELPEEQTTGAIRSIALQDRISVVAPKLVTMTTIDGKAIALVGVRWEQERGIKSYWATEGRFPVGVDEILIGRQVAEHLALATGSQAQILGHNFTVSGTLHETGGDDDSVVFMDIGLLQELLGRPGATSFIEVSALCAGCPIEDIVAQISTNLPNTSVKALQHVVNQRMASVHYVQKLAFLISMVILVTAAAMVGLSMLSAVNERKKDIGILRSLGYAKSRVFLIFCLEAAMIGALAGAIGYLGGFGLSFKALELLSMAEGARPIFSIGQLALTSLVFAAIAVGAALYPSWKGATVEPSSALVSL